MRSEVILFNLLACLKLTQVISASAFCYVEDYNSDCSGSSSKKSLTNSYSSLIDLISDNQDDFEISIPTIDTYALKSSDEGDGNNKSSPLRLYDEIIGTIDEDEDYETRVGTALSAKECAEPPVAEEEEGGAIPTLFPHQVGIRNHALNCYASALIACLYNIPVVQEALFADVLRRINEPNTSKRESLPVALAAIFYKMRSAKSFVDLESFFAAAVKTTIDWEFEVMECVLEFWVRLSAGLPEEVSGLFKVVTTENHFRKSDNLLIKSTDNPSNIILVSPSKKYKTIEKMLENDFIDEDAEDFIIEPEEQDHYAHVLDGPIVEKHRIPSVTTFKIINRPKVLIFGIKRIYWDAETQEPALNTTPLGFPEILKLNEEEYTCLGNIEYDLGRRHYFAQNLDLLSDQWYVHDDKRVERIPDTTKAFNELSDRFVTNSCMVFYIKSSLIDEYLEEGGGSKLDIPAEVLAKLTSRAFKQQAQATIKEQAEEKILEKKAESASIPPVQKRGRPSKKKSKIREVAEVVIEEPKKRKRPQKFFGNEAAAIKRVRGRGPYKKKSPENEFDLTEFENYFEEQVTNGRKIVAEPASQRLVVANDQKVLKYFRSPLGEIADIKLGQGACVFTEEPRNFYLEHVLVTLSRNPAVLEILFEEVKTKSPGDLIFRVTLVILKILLGHGDISTAALTKELEEIHGFKFADIQSTWMDLSKLLPERIAPIPNHKLVIYKNDEPIEIFAESECDHVKLKPYRSKAYPSRLNMNGIYYDMQDGEDIERTRRNIFKSDGAILPIGVDRFIPASSVGESATYDPAPVYMHSHNRHINSYIGYDPARKETFSAHWNVANSNQILLFYKGAPRVVPLSEDLIKMIQHGMQHFSELLMFSKLEDGKKDMPMLSDVPRILLDELNITEISKE